MDSVRQGMRLIGLLLAGLMGVSSACAQSGAMERIRKDGVIKLGYIAGAAPFSSRDERGEPQVSIQRHDIADEGREGAEACRDRLLVTDVGKHRLENREPRARFDRQKETGLCHRD